MAYPDSTGTTNSPPPDGEDKKPRPVACAQCHSSKVKCDKSFPCSRCVRLNMADQCTPHVSQQGRGKKRRRNAANANANANADSGASGGASGGKVREKGGGSGGKTGGGSNIRSQRKSKQAEQAPSSAAGARGGGTSAAAAAAPVHNSMSASSSSVMANAGVRAGAIMGGGSPGLVTGADLAIGGEGGMNNTGSHPTQGGVSLGGGIADVITGSLGLHHGYNANVNLGLPAVHAHAALGHRHNNTGNLGPSAIKAAPTSSASDSQTNASASNANSNSNSNGNRNNAIATGPKTGIEENLSVSATSLGPNHFGLRHLLRTWVAFAIKRRSFSLLAKASTLAAKTGVTMDNILCGEDDSVAATAAQASAATLGPSALIAAADASGGLNCHSHHAALSVLSGASAATGTGTRTGGDAHSSDSAVATVAAGNASANTRMMPDQATNTTGGDHNAISSPSAASTAAAAASSLTEPMSFLLPALLTPASSQEMENSFLSWAELPAELLTATGCHVPLTQGASNDIAPVLGSRWIFVRWLHQGRSRYFVSPAFERDIVSWATIQSTWNANNREVTGLFVPRSEMPTHTRGIMHQFAIHPRVGMPLRANRYKTKIKVRAAVAPMGSAPSAEEPGMVEMVVDGVMCQKMISLDTAFLFIEYVRDEVTPATVLASLSNHGAATGAATTINAHSQQQQQMQPQLHGAMAGIGSSSMVPSQAQLQGNQLLAQMAANMIGAGNAGANDYHRTNSNMSGNSVSSDAIANAVLRQQQQRQQQQQQAVGVVDGNSGSITPQALVSGAGGTGSGLDGLDFFDLDGSHASLAEMDDLLNLIRQCP